MSRGAYLLPGARWGGRMGDMQAVDYMLGILHDPFHRIHMGITAENIAERLGISREAQDALALQSQQRAARAIAEGRFAGQIVPVEVKTRKGVQLFEVDEHVRGETSLEQLAAMKTAFKAGGTVTAGNASGLNDGAAALLMASGAAVKSDNLRPLARLVSYAHAGVDPELMGLGPIPATRLALQRAGLSVADLDVIESNEAFAAVVLRFCQELDLELDQVNRCGGAIALGHPLGATGAMIFGMALDELERTHTRYACIALCVGAGQGTATVIERLS